MLKNLNIERIKSFLGKGVIPSIVFSVVAIGYYFSNYQYKTFSFIGLVVGLLCFLLALIIFANSKRSDHIIWGFFNIAVSVWGFGCFFIGISDGDYINAIYSWKVFVLGITFIPVFCYHFISEYTGKKFKYFLRFCYIQAIVFSIINLFSNLLVNDLVFVFNQFYYLKANFFYSFFFSIWVLIVIVSFFSLYKYYKISTGVKRAQSAYLFYGMLLGFLGGSTTAPLAWGIDFYPSGHFLTCLYAAISTYAILKYQLVDIKIVVTRVSVFIAVYSLVLGIPFLVAFGLQDWLKAYIGETWWLSPLILMTILATAGPFIYLAIQNRAEEKLFQDQRRYQGTLRQAATGMGRIKDMDKLIGLIVHIVTRSVRVEHSVVFLKQKGEKKYTFEGARSRHHAEWDVKEMDAKSPLVKALVKVQQPLVYSELKQRAADNPHSKLDQVVEQMEQLHAELIVPSFIDENMIAFMAMGRKISGELYSDDDLAVFSILASQAALAIENCQFYRDMRATHEQLFQAEKMATIGIMADGLSHQINNRLHALGFIAGDALDTICLKKDAKMSDEIKEVMLDLEHALTRIQENVMQGGEIVRGLLKYSRKQDESFSEVELTELIEEAFKMAQFKIKKDSMDLVLDFPSGLPKIMGNFTELQEVFFNLFDNAYDAMMQRKEELKEEGYRPTIEIKAEPRGRKWISVVLRDNGMGIKMEDHAKIFTPFFTTKLSSKKGTGLGLYVIQKLIEENHKGKVVYRSEYMKGTRVYVTLPTC